MNVLTATTLAHTALTKKKGRQLLMAGLVGTTCIVVGAGYISWRVVQPGVSLFGPTALASLIMSLTASAWYFALRTSGGPRVHRSLWLIVVALCLVPPLWTFFGVLPSSINWDSAAVNVARAAISSRSQTCREVSTGSVGLLRSPYLVCSSNPGDGYVVTFTTMDRGRGYAYVQQRLDLSWFPHECANHLEGHWWAFNVSVNPSIGGSCPMWFPENPAA